VWKKDVGAGFAAPVVSQDRLILFHRRGGSEIVEALDAASGREIWKFEYATKYRDDFGFDEGPRSAPTVAAGRVFSFGAEGMLHCLPFASGKKIWSVDTMSVFQVPKGFFGAAGSPLIDGNRVLLNVGGANAGIVAFDAATGKTLWTATNHQASYSSGVVATIAGERRALFLTRAGLVDVDPATGKVRWDAPWRARMQASVNAASPLVVGDSVFITASYDTGASLVRIGAGGPKQVWGSDESLSAHYATPVHKDGFLYGFHGRQEFGQALRCIELATGKVRWSEEKYGAGTVTLAGDKLLIVRESGDIVLAEASRAGYKPLATAHALPKVVRAYPAIAGGRLYIRNERTLACLNLK
jgi:outer membrane protein assembly factor BamB